MTTALPGLPLSMDDDALSPEDWEKQKKIWEDKTKSASSAAATEQLINGEVSPNMPVPEEHFIHGWLTAKKGNPNSGNHGHKGIPGQVGGSAPGDGMGAPAGAVAGANVIAQPTAGGGSAAVTSPRPTGAPQNPANPQTPVTGVGEPRGGAYATPKKKFNAAEFDALSVPDRVAKWEQMSMEERDDLANARQAVRVKTAQLLAGAGARPAFSGNVKADLATRLNACKDMSMPDAHERIVKVVDEADSLLEKIGVNPQVRHQLGMEMADALVSQEHEAMSRQLGDHGIRHLQGNIENSNMVLDKVPGQSNDRAKAQIYISQIFHDTGYLTEPSGMFLDEGHKRWSAEHYDENIRPIVEKAMGKPAASEITHIIRTHDDTSLDWESDPVASAVRVADNMALFHKEKLPPLFRVKGNLSLLTDAHTGKLSIEDARAKMIENINASPFSDKVKGQLTKGANEVSKMTGKFTLGMLGGYISGASWKNGHINIELTRNKNQDLLNRMLDLGQKQFAKFAKSYKVDPDKFLKDLNFEFPQSPPPSRVLLSAEIVGLKEKAMRILYGRKR